MNVLDAIEKLEWIVKQGHGSDELVIPLSEASVARRACTAVKSITKGYDWNRGRVFIYPEKDVLSKEHDRDALKPMRIIEAGRARKAVQCPVCEEILRKDFNFCSNCGQRVKPWTNLHTD